jgi:hypothetical protein
MKIMRKYHAEFTERNLTANAGLVHLGQFTKKLGLRTMLEQDISILRGPNAQVSVADAIMMLVMGVVVGAKHMSHLAILRTDAVIRALFQWKNFPDDTTFCRLFKLFQPVHCHELSEVEGKVRTKVWYKKWFGRITLDMHSTVKGVYGSQQGAEQGFNTTNKGQKSYCSLLCFIAETRECLHNWFRSGSASLSNGAMEFMKECFPRIPKRVQNIFVRADSGFFKADLLELLEEKGAQYLIKVETRDLVASFMQQAWRKAKNKPGVETTEFSHQCHGWKAARRFVAVRTAVDTETKGRLFPMPHYEFVCYVTNLSLTPWEAHACYGKRRTASQNWIEWCKNQMASGSILTQDFWANSAIFQTCILAYNLLVWMMWLTYEKGFREEPDTIRAWLIHVPARLLHGSRQWVLKLSKTYLFEQEWQSIESSLAELGFA